MVVVVGLLAREGASNNVQGCSSQHPSNQILQLVGRQTGLGCHFEPFLLLSLDSSRITRITNGLPAVKKQTRAPSDLRVLGRGDVVGRAKVDLLGFVGGVFVRRAGEEVDRDVSCFWGGGGGMVVDGGRMP